MLAAANRLVHADDFRGTVRRGRRVVSGFCVLYTVETQRPSARFGFIVSRAVGGSVTRHLVTRRFRAIGRELVDENFRGHDVVIRALPGIDRQPFAVMRQGVRRALTGEVEAA